MTNGILSFNEFVNESMSPVNWKSIVDSVQYTDPNIVKSSTGESLHWGAPDHDKDAKDKQWAYGFSVSYPSLEYVFSSDLDHEVVKKKFDDIATKHGVAKLWVIDGAWKSSGKAPADLRGFIIDVLRITGFPYS